MKPKTRLLIIAVGVVLVVVIAGALMARRHGRSAEPAYLTQKVGTGDLERSVLASGTLQPLEVVDVGAQATGQIQSLKVALGDHVKKGQILAVIDPANQQNTLRNGEAQLAQQKAQRRSQAAGLARDQLTLDRQKSLLATGFVAQSAYDLAAATVDIDRANLDAIDQQIQQAQITVDKAKVDLGRTNIVAPIDGIVSDIAVREGQTINAVQAAPTIVRISKMDVMTVKAQISEADVINVHPGLGVYFTILGDPDRRYYATLRQVEPSPPTTTGQSSSSSSSSGAAVYYNALFDVPNPDGRLRPSMTAQVNVVLNMAKGATVVPSAALTKGANGYSVKVKAADGTVSVRPVTIGLNTNVKAEVKSGLKPGEEVVVAEQTQAQAREQQRAAAMQARAGGRPR